MRTLIVTLFVAISVTASFACGHCGKSGKCCDRPDWGYTYSDPHYMPDCAPRALKCFQSELIPMLEARVTHESAYLRENARCLYGAARRVLDAAGDPCCPQMEKSSKHYKRAAKDLVKDCERLKEIVYGGTSRSVYDQMKQVEEDFVRLSNLCED